MYRFPILALALLAAPLASAQSFGGYEVDWDQVGALVNEHFELPAQLPPLANMGAALRLVENTLRQGSIEDLARLAPYARQAHALLRENPRLTPYVDWLTQRLDYLEVASEILAPPPAPSPTPRIRPTGRPPAPRPTRVPQVNDAAIWEKKMKARNKPRGAEALVPVLKPVFAREGIPVEWVWLAEVESSFNPQARSPVGAVGLFQLMPATARHLGLDTEPEDERIHPEKNARAAAKYLRYLHGRFQDWPLVLAAYNGGEGRVSGLMRRHGRSFEAIAAHLPAETRMYVPKVLATVARREGVDAKSLPAPGPVAGR